jgi:hypothetical protein
MITLKINKKIYKYVNFKNFKRRLLLEKVNLFDIGKIYDYYDRGGDVIINMRYGLTSITFDKEQNLLKSTIPHKKYFSHEHLLKEKYGNNPKSHSDYNPFIFDWDRCYTKQLFNLYRKHFTDNYPSKYSESRDIFLNNIMKILNKREHIPNKIQSKNIIKKKMKG